MYICDGSCWFLIKFISLLENQSDGEYSGDLENETGENESCGNDMGDNSDYGIGDN